MSATAVINDTFRQSETVLKIAGFLNADGSDSYNGRCVIKGLYGSSKGYFISSAIESSSRKYIHIIIEESREAAEYFCGDLYSIFGENVFYFPLSKDSSKKVQRSSAISAINSFSQKSDNIIIVSYPDAVKELILNRKSLSNAILDIKKGDNLPFDFIKETLLNAEFEKVDFVEEPGQFAVRGSIIDLFSYSDSTPYRVDFFGNNIESIKHFDINTQRSSDELEKIEIFPNLFEKEKLAAEGGVSVFEYAGSNAIIIWNDTYENLSELYSDTKRVYINMIPAEEQPQVEVSENISPQPSFNKNFGLLCEDIVSRNKAGYKVYISCADKSQEERIKAVISGISASHESKRANEQENQNAATPSFEILPYSIHEGFAENTLKICVYTDHQIFDRFHRVKIKREVERSERLTLEELNSFHTGDYVVHINYGVGVFGGLVKTEVDGKIQEAVKLLYKDGDVIFVSIHGLHRIAKYKSRDAEPPKIYKIGSGAWQRLKSKTKAKIKDIAKDLIELYAKRRQVKGFAFSPDSYMQQELEASFMYEDTPDQVSASQAVKEDMEKEYPMDRLICGDVGFGKTEIAIRAAFKAVTDSKQVAVLVPTTILALQHYQTFKERLDKFPCNIDFISRLRTAAESKDILKKLSEGKTDIIIGTHKLLNKKIKFKNLGLLIIDEEQKFGVAAKERLRQLKLEVDTLTLTATPIPRTLQFSLLGARDLSIINTPPPNRLPVQTEVVNFNEELIKSVINNEIERGGQVFFIHNRVEDIEAVQMMVKRLCPKAKTLTGHGQMEPKELESRMLAFIRGDYDVLISTTIIENGIDIPNANTMIINQAQNFGLSDLHQLRGRVGRSNQKAYCYLIVPPLTSITEDARRRLKAIEAFSDLGSGFNIAMQDLDIRGAGNLLGGEQSGFIADMGFETYQRILNEAFAEINSSNEFYSPGSSSDSADNQKNTGTDRVQVVRKQRVMLPADFITDCTVDTDLELYIPDDYVQQTEEKLRLYKELDTMIEEKDIQNFLDNLNDRFGKVPVQVLQLTYVVRIRRAAIKLGFEKITIKGGVMLLYFVNDKDSYYYKTETFAEILQWVNRQRRCQLKDNGNKLWIRIEDVNSIEKGYNIVNQILLPLGAKTENSGS